MFFNLKVVKGTPFIPYEIMAKELREKERL